MKNPKFTIRQAQSGHFYFVLTGRNGRVISSSVLYTTKDSCKAGIESLRKNAAEAAIEDVTVGINKKREAPAPL